MNTAVFVQFKVQRTNTIVVVYNTLEDYKTKRRQKEDKNDDDACTSIRPQLKARLLLSSSCPIYTTCYMQMLGYRQPSTHALT